MSRLLADPLEADVAVDAAGVPLRVGLSRGAAQMVERVCARWRVETDWWRAPVVREYWKVLLTGEAGLCDVYQDRLTGRWWLSRLYD